VHRAALQLCLQRFVLECFFPALLRFVSISSRFLLSALLFLSAICQIGFALIAYICKFRVPLITYLIFRVWTKWWRKQWKCDQRISLSNVRSRRRKHGSSIEWKNNSKVSHKAAAKECCMCVKYFVLLFWTDLIKRYMCIWNTQAFPQYIRSNISIEM
jgi:hypothetical protein